MGNEAKGKKGLQTILFVIGAVNGHVRAENWDFKTDGSGLSMQLDGRESSRSI